MKAGAVAADVESVALLGPVGMLAAGVNDGDSTLKDFLELEGKKRLARASSCASARRRIDALSSEVWRSPSRCAPIKP